MKDRYYFPLYHMYAMNGVDERLTNSHPTPQGSVRLFGPDFSSYLAPGSWPDIHSDRTPQLNGRAASGMGWPAPLTLYEYTDKIRNNIAHENEKFKIGEYSSFDDIVDAFYCIIVKIDEEYRNNTGFDLEEEIKINMLDDC